MGCESRAHPDDDDARVQALQLHADVADVSKRTRQTLVRVTSITDRHEESVSAELAQTQVIVDRVPIGRIVDAVPPVRVEGGVTIMPVVEEELVLIKRLVLKEEVHLRTVSSVSHYAETVTLRRQDVLVTRTELGDRNSPGSKMAAATRNNTMTDQDQTIVAIYDTPAHAELAVQDLLQAGVPEAAVHRHAQEGSYTGRAAEATTRTTEGTGFWASLFGGEPDHDATVYDRSVQSGGNAVSVTSAGRARDESVMDILESHNPIDIDERGRQLRPDAAAQATLPAAGMHRTGMSTRACATRGWHTGGAGNESGKLQLSGGDTLGRQARGQPGHHADPPLRRRDAGPADRQPARRACNHRTPPGDGQPTGGRLVRREDHRDDRERRRGRGVEIRARRRRSGIAQGGHRP